MSQRFSTVRARTVVLPASDVDTDQIIPARFLKGTTREGLGRSLFADWRYDKDGRPRPEFVLNRPEAQGAQILVAGANFGCGSSREHAVWALHDHGFRVVVSTAFADIFRNNALKNSLLPVQLEAGPHARLLAQSGVEVEVDLAAQSLSLPDGTRVLFPIDPFARHCLLNGIDALDFLLEHESAIAAHEAASSARGTEVERSELGATSPLDERRVQGLGGREPPA
jgi:3-isopropylmalate/(R)-2-methylmalate dehydratase small subunit